MRPKLSGNILFVFSDPGGAKPCLALIEENNIQNAVAVSDKRHSFYIDFTTKVQILEGNFQELIDLVQPTLIFTGTSYTSNIEKNFIRIATNKNISCYSFVDHWTSFIKRFSGTDGKIILPDQIWVIDKRAKQLAINDGIPADRILITGNPYYEWLKKWKPSITKKLFVKNLGLEDNQKFLLFAPDPLSNVDGQNIYGIDEISGTLALISLFHNNQIKLQDWIVLIKTHPNQDRIKLESIIPENASFKLLPADVDTNTVMFYADLVMGFFSSLLIEANIMNRKIIRFFPTPVKIDPIAELNIGTLVNNNTLLATLLKY